jgi:phosphonate transport system permease protein
LTDATASGAAPAASGSIPAAPTKSASAWAMDILLWGGLLLILVFSFGKVDMANLPRLFTESQNIQLYGKDLLDPEWGAIFPQAGDWLESLKLTFTAPDRSLAGQMWLTIQIALWGTFLAVFLAVPLGLMAARNIAPAWLVWPVRRVMDLLRSIPDLVMATIFIVAVGLGPLAGVLALAMNTGGVLAKLFSEAVESIDKGPVEGVRATGAGKLHEIVWGVIPQVAPLWTSFALYRFESNSRAATVLGLIGAGGIGQTLFESIQAFDYHRVAAIAIVIVVAVTLIDTLSQVMRKRLL